MYSRSLPSELVLCPSRNPQSFSSPGNIWELLQMMLFRTKDTGAVSDVLSIAELHRFSHDDLPFEGPENIRVSIAIMLKPRLTDRLASCVP